MTPSINSRVNQLLQSGLGLSAQDIAAIVGADSADVLHYTADQTHVIPPVGGGGSAIKSALVMNSSLALASAPAPITFTVDDVLDDQIGIILPVEGPYLLLPKGYYSFVLGLAAQIVDDTTTDVLRFQAGMIGEGLHAGAQVPVGSGGLIVNDAAIGTRAELNTGAGIVMSIPLACESGDQDVHELGFAEHGFVLVQIAISAQNVTAAVEYTGALTVGYKLYIQKVGDKA